MASNYNPSNWYWSVAGSTTEVWSSARCEYVPVTDLVYVAWAALSMNRTTAIDSEADLAALLQAQFPAGWPVLATLTPLSFMALFTSSEQSSVYAAAITTPSLLAFLFETAGADYISLSDPRIAAGLSALVAAGLLTSGRETAILAGQPAPVTAPATTPAASS